MKTNKIIATLSIGLGVIGAFAAYAIAPPLSSSMSVEIFHYSLSSNICMLFLHIGAAVLFSLGIVVYKEDLRRAFNAIVIGIILQAIGLLQLPILDMLDAWGTPYVTYGFVGLPFLLYGLLTYIGASAFGKLVGTPGISPRRLAVIPLSLIIPIVVLFLPHTNIETSEFAFDATNFVLSWTTMLLAAAAIVFFRTGKRVGAHYAQSISWLCIALVGSAICLAVATIDSFVIPAVSPLSIPLDIASLIAGLIWVKAGYSFSKTKEY